MAGPREGQIGTAPDGTRVVFRNGEAVPVGGPDFPGFVPQGNGIYEDDSGGTFQINRQGQLIRRGGTAGGNAASSRASRKDFEALQPVKDFRDTQASLGTIQAAARDGTGASDMAMVFALNKLLDPGSVVREGEYDRALNVGGLREQLAGYITKLQNGEFLTPEVRSQLVNTAQSLYEVRRDQYNNFAQRYQGIAREDGLPNPNSVAKQEFGGQRVTSNPDVQEMGQANTDQVKARPANYDRKAPLGSPSHPYVLSPGVGPDDIPPGSSYIDEDGKLVSGGGEAQGPGSSAENPYQIVGSSREDTIAALQRGGWFQNAEGDPYQLPPTTPEFGAQTGDQMVGSGVAVRSRTDEDRGWTPESAVEQRRDMNPILRGIDAFGRGFADITSLESADELAAGGDALFGQGVGDSIGGRYRNNLAVQRAVDKADGEDVGFVRNAGEVAGGVAGALIAGPRLLTQVGAKAAPLVRGGLTIARNVLAGQGVSALTAANATEGDVLQRGQNALKAATNPITAVASAVVPAGINALAGPTTRAGERALRYATRQIGVAGEGLGIRGANALAERNAATPLQDAISMFGGRTRADGNILSQRAAEQRALGLEPTLVDITDDAGRGLVRGAATRQTPARDAAVEFGRSRRVEAQGNASDLARKYVSNEPRTAAQLANDLDDEQSRLSGVAYDIARRSPPIQIGPDVTQALFGPRGRSAMKSASDLYSASADPAERALSQELSALANTADEFPQGSAEMSVGAADLISRYLQKAGGTDLNERRIFGSLGTAVRSAARDQSDEYADALSGYAERAQLDDALAFGQGFLGRKGTTEYARQAAELTPVQRDVARVSARDAIEDRANTPAGAASLLDDLSVGRGASQRADGLLGEDAAPMAQTAAAMRARVDAGRGADPRYGSQTNLNAQDSAVMNGLETAGDVIGAATFQPGALLRLGRRFMSIGFSDSQAQSLVEAAIDPSRTDELISMLSKQMPRRDARALARSVRHNVSAYRGSSSVE